MKQLFLLATSLMLVNCIDKTKNDFDLAIVKTQIETANKTYGERFFKNDSTMYNHLYTKDAIVMPEFGASVQGRTEIFNYYYNGGKNEPITIDLKVTSVYGSSDLVSEEGTYVIKDKTNQILDEGKFIALWKQEDNTWKLHREIWNTNKMPK